MGNNGTYKFENPKLDLLGALRIDVNYYINHKTVFYAGDEVGEGTFINYDKLYGRSNNSSNSSSKVFDGKLVYLAKGQAGVKYNNFNVGGFAKGKFSGRNWV